MDRPRSSRKRSTRRQEALYDPSESSSSGLSDAPPSRPNPLARIPHDDDSFTGEEWDEEAGVGETSLPGKRAWVMQTLRKGADLGRGVKSLPCCR